MSRGLYLLKVKASSCPVQILRGPKRLWYLCQAGHMDGSVGGCWPAHGVHPEVQPAIVYIAAP